MKRTVICYAADGRRYEFSVFGHMSDAAATRVALAVLREREPAAGWRAGAVI